MSIVLTEPDRDNVLTVHASGRINDLDQRVFTGKLDHFVEQRGKLSLLLDLQDFRGWDVHGAWDELVRDLRHRNDFRRVAIVGDKAWEKMLVYISRLFTSARVRFYRHDEMAHARRWVHKG